MKSNLSQRAMMVTLVIGAALTSTGQAQPDISLNHELADISRYCQACWRNARLPADTWEDCTQAVFARLLERVGVEQFPAVLGQDGLERKEFLRAIDTVKKRTQRNKRYASIILDVPDRTEANQSNEWETVEQAARAVLSARQQRILQLSREGYAVPEIAAELRTTVDRVSDEKYKAIRKLRRQMTDSASAEA